jgi:hypothetical protein
MEAKPTGAWTVSHKMTIHLDGADLMATDTQTQPQHDENEKEQTEKLTVYGPNINTNSGRRGDILSLDPAWTLNLLTDAVSAAAEHNAVLLVEAAYQALQASMTCPTQSQQYPWQTTMTGTVRMMHRAQAAKPATKVKAVIKVAFLLTHQQEPFAAT